MTSTTTTSSLGSRVPSLETAWQDVDSSFERFCLTAGTQDSSSSETRPCSGAEDGNGLNDGLRRQHVQRRRP